jgi:hypothetical protein
MPRPPVAQGIFGHMVARPAAPIGRLAPPPMVRPQAIQLVPPMPRPPGVAHPAVPPPVIHQILEDEDEEEDEDDDDDDEEDDEEDDEGEDDDDGEHDSRYDGSNATAEYAASGRSRCVVCNLTIAREAVRIIVSQRSYGYYEPSSRFIHPHCIRPFNEMVSARQRILPGRLNLRAISARDSITVRNHC